MAFLLFSSVWSKLFKSIIYIYFAIDRENSIENKKLPFDLIIISFYLLFAILLSTLSTFYSFQSLAIQYTLSFQMLTISINMFALWSILFRKRNWNPNCICNVYVSVSLILCNVCIYSFLLVYFPYFSCYHSVIAVSGIFENLAQNGIFTIQSGIFVYEIFTSIFDMLLHIYATG